MPPPPPPPLDDDQISRFVSITGASPSDASQFLELTQNNFELAIDLYMDGSQSRPATSNQARASEKQDKTDVFEDSLHNAQLLDKLVLVFLRDPHNNQCVEFGAFVWNNPTVKEHLVELGFYLLCLEWGTEDAARLVAMYAVEENNSLLVIEPETGQELCKIAIVLDVEAFIQNCTQFIEQHHHSERSEHPNDNLLTALSENEQVERAIRESLDTGRESLEQRSILKSSSFEGTFPETTDPNAIKILIRMPNGTKATQAFYPTDPVMRIFQFVQQKFSAQIDPNKDFDLYFEGKRRLFEHRDRMIKDLDLKNACLVFDYE